MKKNLLLTLVLFFTLSFNSSAQTEKGSKIIGGGASVQFKPLVAIINPGVGYFLVDNFALGAQLPISYIEDNSIYSYSIGISPFVRYYVGKSTTRPFVGAFGGISKVWRGYDFSGNGFGRDKLSEPSNNFGLNLGVVHFITKQVGLEAALIYNNEKLVFDGSGPTRQEALSFNLGFQIYLSKSSE